MTRIKNKIQNSRKGFTLIELLVVMAIIGILAATAIVNIGKNDDRDVRAEKDRLTSFIRDVQNKSLAVERSGISVSGKVCGFGFRQSESNIESFYTYTADLNGNCSANWESYADSGAYETFHPAGGITLGLTGGIFFISPNGDVECDDGCSLPNYVTIEKGGDASATVTVDAAGRIY